MRDLNIMKHNYLIVMPRLVRSASDGYIFPLGIPYISASLKHAGYNVSTLNLNHSEGLIKDILEKKIREADIDVVFTGGLSAQFSAVKIIVDSIKEIDPNLLVVVGGGLISAEPEVAMEALEHVDFGVIGEGEITCTELCKALENKTDINEVDGLIFHDPKGSYNYIVTNSRKEIKDLDTLPWPDYEGFDYEKNLSSATGLFSFGSKRMAYVISSRSCPFNCTFCFHTSGKKYRQRSIENLFNELDYLISKYNIDEICIADELFAQDINRLRRFCEKITNYHVTWNASFRVDNVTAEMISLIKGTNCCSWMGFGLESADNRILKSMRKNITIEQIESALNLCHGSGIPVQGNFIFGDIEETVESAEKSLHWLKDNQMKYNIKVAHIIAYPGTYIYKYACEKKMIKDKVQFLKDGCPQKNISRMTIDEYSKLSTKIAIIMSEPKNNSALFEVYDFDNNNGFISVKGICNACGTRNTWGKVRLFKYSFMVCTKCGQKFSPPLHDKNLISNIESNFQYLLERFGKVAVWGMSDHIVTVFRHSQIMQNKKIFPVDISDTKQGHSLFGNEVFSPEIIDKEQIETVIVAAAMHIGIIESQIRVQFPHVKTVIDISNLIGSHYDPDAI